MYLKSINLLIFFVLAAGNGRVHADIIILRSGELFQTRRAWKDGDVVRYYKNGRVVGIDAGEVERLIHSPPPHAGTSPTDSNLAPV